MDYRTPPPRELRDAGATLMAIRLRDELDLMLSTTRRGRLALRLARWHVRLAATTLRKRHP
jgi:hypothetical protein